MNLGAIDQKIRSGATQSAPNVPTSADDQKTRTGAGLMEPTTSEGEEEEAPDDMTAKIKKYAPYAIAAVVLYYIISKK
jgi:hypothetical protein